MAVWAHAPSAAMPAQLLRSSTLVGSHAPLYHPLLTSAERQRVRQVFNLTSHVSCYGHHACKHTFLCQIYVPTSLRSSRYQMPGWCTHCLGTWNGWCASTARCFSEQPTRAALWQLQRYARTQITYLDTVYLPPGQQITFFCLFCILLMEDKQFFHINNWFAVLCGHFLVSNFNILHFVIRSCKGFICCTVTISVVSYWEGHGLGLAVCYFFPSNFHSCEYCHNT